MNWLNPLKGSLRSASGLEWKIWRRLPIMALVGALLSALLWLAFHWILDPQISAVQSRWLLKAGYMAVGALIFYWMMLLTLAIACAIVMVMKGPAYVADAYPLSHRDQPLGNDSEASGSAP